MRLVRRPQMIRRPRLGAPLTNEGIERFYDQWALGHAIKSAGGKVFVPGPPLVSDDQWFVFKVTPDHEADGFYIEVVE